MASSKYLTAAVCAALVSSAAFAAPYPRSTTPDAVDLGVTQNTQARLSLTIALKLQNATQLQSAIDAVHTPGNPNYHHWLTTQQFAAQYGPSAATIQQVTQHFQSKGFTVSRSATAELQVSGTVAAVQSEFGVQLHGYSVASSDGVPGYTFLAPASSPTISAEIAASVAAVVGLDTRPRYSPNFLSGNPIQKATQVNVTSSGTPSTPDVPGLWTVVDFAQYYNVTPLYQQNLTGAGQTLAIVTFAGFTPSDAFGYWNSLGLKVNNNRLTQVMIDGGSGPPSDAAGSIETTLDVEQSGGLAPGANIQVFEAPNTDQGFVDNFAAAVDRNAASTLSVSWGEWEWYNTLQYHGASIQASLTNILAESAMLGQSFFTASGDSGGYEANNPEGSFKVPRFNRVVSVGDPGALANITAVGGTTLPGTQTFSLPNGGTYSVTVPAERVWGWDYLTGLCTALGYNQLSCGIFPVGGGGGVSSYTPLPSYQYGVPGITTTPAGQSLQNPNNIPLPPQVTLPINLPAGYAGRNTPDISLNSDPETGYIIWYTSSTSGFEIENHYGGTSFAAPQFNGVASLLVQGLGGRVGLMNYPIYAIQKSGKGYSGSNAPFRDIRVGDNWYWQAQSGYDQGSGVGVPNVANLFGTLQSLQP